MKCKCTTVYATTIITISLFLVMININNNNIDSFYAQAATIPDFNFGSAGDWGCNSNTVDTVNSIQNQKPELVLGLGDYSYQSTANCWLSAVNPIDEKMNITIGNHENSASSEDLNTYLNHFGMNSQYYSFNYENVHFLSMATEISYSSGSSQNLFVKNDLASAAVNPNIDWIVVYFHKPMYSSPNSCSSCGGETALRDLYHPIFDQYGVDIVLEGHTHDYQRSFPIKFNSNSK
ncbi:MAG TPA: metallophosphoesterase, partial [Nitrososphaeraceae archaeon]|nr:metallophosphoesterase [Nitrososphaeraceae archaeon]